jgi:hypothetical protein
MSCPFSIGDCVVFTPSARTRGLYQAVESFGMEIGKTYVVREIRDDMYVYTDSGAGGWPWNEFTAQDAQNQRSSNGGQ